MTAYRLRAHLRFAPGRGLAAWAQAQNANRLSQAYHLNPGRADEERSRQGVTGEVYSCDLAFPQSALAQDTWNTLIAVCTAANLSAPTGREYSWMDLHECAHEGTPQPCPPPVQAWNNLPQPAAAWVQPTGAHDAYAVGAVVTHNGQRWTNTHPANTYAPGVYGWTAAA